jgi:hypothetical protein
MNTENDSPRDNDARQLFAKLNSDYINSLAKEQVKDRVNELSIVQDEARRLFARKNKDYGDSFATYGPIGVIVRIGDKIQRLQSITRSNITMVNDESIRDTLIDLHNYSAMAIMLMDEETKTKKTQQEQENQQKQEQENQQEHQQKQHNENKEQNVICEAGLGTYTVNDLTN